MVRYSILPQGKATILAPGWAKIFANLEEDNEGIVEGDIETLRKYRRNIKASFRHWRKSRPWVDWRISIRLGRLKNQTVLIVRRVNQGGSGESDAGSKS